MAHRLADRFSELERLALAAGLKHFDVHFFEVPSKVIWQTASYGLPVRYSHWSFGRAYQHQQSQGEMGFSKIYELIINNDPAIALLDSSNTDTANLMIAAHCYAHSDFFRNNIMFVRANETKMVDAATQHAAIIDQFRNEYGDDEVDDWLDIALAFERHVDAHRMLKRKKYPKRQVRQESRKIEPYEDLDIKREPLVKKVVEGLHIPPHQEKDLLWFLSEYASLEPWQQKIFEIVRRESYYFYPQYRTKIMNEGWASYWHAELMAQYGLGNDNDYGAKDINNPLTSEEHLDFVSLHEKVVQPGLKLQLKVPEVDQNGKKTGRKGWNPILSQRPSLFNSATRLNPYYVGFKLFRHIEEKWDEYYKKGFMEDKFGKEIPVTITGKQKIREVMEEEDDVSFLRKYLDEDIADELHLFAYGNSEEYDDNYEYQEQAADKSEKKKSTEQTVKNGTVVVSSKKVDDVVKALARSHNNYGVPCIIVRRVDESGSLRLEHLPDDSVNLDLFYAEQVLKYVYEVWKRPVELIRKDKDKTWTLIYDGISFTVDHQGTDYPECVENTDIPSSW